LHILYYGTITYAKVTAFNMYIQNNTSYHRLFLPTVLISWTWFLWLSHFILLIRTARQYICF